MNIFSYAFLFFAVQAYSAGNDFNCNAAAPVPLLKKTTYPSHSWMLGRDNTAKERVTLPDGIGLEINYSGCVDAKGVEFTFTITRSKSAKASTADWVAFVDKKFSTLQFTNDASYIQAVIKKFLKKALKLKPMPDEEISICHDGNMTTKDGWCEFESGGGNKFQVNQSGKTVKVVVLNYDYL